MVVAYQPVGTGEPCSVRTLTAEEKALLPTRLRPKIGKGQTYRGAWYDCVLALRIASMARSVVSRTVVLMALT